MSHAITLTLPDLLFEPVQRIARATNQPVEAVLLKALRVSLPPIDGLPGDIANALEGLEELDHASLDRVMREHVRAAVILRFRGERIPTEAELRRELAPSR